MFFYWKQLTFGCQCNSLNAPGSRLTTVAAIVFAIGKFLESMMDRLPPPPGTGTLAAVPELWNTYELFPVSPLEGPVGPAVLTVAFMMYGSVAGTLVKTDSLTPKFLARTDLGV